MAGSGETGLVEEVLAIFQSDTAERVEAMRAAAAAADRATLRKQAHALKGSAGQVGALPLAEICKTLENTALTAPAPELAELVASIAGEFQDVCGQMQPE